MGGYARTEPNTLPDAEFDRENDLKDCNKFENELDKFLKENSHLSKDLGKSLTYYTFQNENLTSEIKPSDDKDSIVSDYSLSKDINWSRNHNSTSINKIKSEQRNIEKYHKNDKVDTYVQDYLNDDKLQKPRGSFRLSILDVLHRKNETDFSRYYDLPENKKLNLFINEDISNNVLSTYTDNLDSAPIKYIIGDYLHKTNNDSHINPYATNNYSLTHNKPLLTKISPPNEEQFYHETPASMSIITPPPSDLALSAFKTTSSDSVTSNNNRIPHNLEHDYSVTPNHTKNTYPNPNIITSSNLQCKDRFQSLKKNSFDPLSALNEVLMLQTSKGDNHDNEFTENNSNHNSVSYSIDDIIQPLNQVRSTNTFNRSDFYPPETNYDQKSTLMLTNLANNIDRLSIIDSAQSSKNKQSNTNFHYMKKAPEEYTHSLKDINTLDPDVGAHKFENNRIDINNDTIEDKIIQNLRRNHPKELSYDSNKFDYLKSSGVGKLYERQYKLALAEQMEIEKQNALMSRDDKFSNVNNNSWEDNNIEQSVKILKSKHNGMPKTDSSFHIFKDVKNALDNFSHCKHHASNKKNVAKNSSAVNSSPKSELETPTSLVTFCDCPRMLNSASHSNDSDFCYNTSPNNGFELEDGKMRIGHTTNINKKNGYNKLHKKSKLSNHNVSNGNKPLSETCSISSSIAVKPMIKSSKSSSSFFSKFFKIKKIFSNSSKHQKNNFSEQSTVVHKPHCTLTRSASISKDSLPIIPSPRSTSFRNNAPLRGILKSQKNTSIKSNDRYNNYYNTDTANDHCDSYFENNIACSNDKNSSRSNRFAVDYYRDPFMRAGDILNYNNTDTKNQPVHPNISNGFQYPPIPNYDTKRVPPPRTIAKSTHMHQHYNPQNFSPIPRSLHSIQKFPNKPSPPPTGPLYPPPRRRLSFLNKLPRDPVYPSTQYIRSDSKYSQCDDYSIANSVCNNRNYYNQVFPPPMKVDDGGHMLLEAPVRFCTKVDTINNAASRIRMRNNNDKCGQPRMQWDMRVGKKENRYYYPDHHAKSKYNKV